MANTYCESCEIGGTSGSPDNSLCTCGELSYADMTTEHLGDMATDEDLQLFRSACEAYQIRADCSDREATDYIYGRGDWLRRAYDWAPFHSYGQPRG